VLADSRLIAVVPTTAAPRARPFYESPWACPPWRRRIRCSPSGCLRGVEFEPYSSLIRMNRAIWTPPGGARLAWFKGSQRQRALGLGAHRLT
jgi:hypothetical protein